MVILIKPVLDKFFNNSHPMPPTPTTKIFEFSIIFNNYFPYNFSSNPLFFIYYYSTSILL
jgi:hypothetical protein